MAHVVFDFDGTLADSLSVALGVYNNIATEKGYKHIDQVEWQKIRKLSVPQGVKYVGIKPYQVPGLLARGRRDILDHAADIQLFPGVKKLIQDLRADGHTLYVLSTNSKIVVHTVLEKSRLDEDVEILNSAPVFGKASALKKLTRKTGGNKEDIWMVGDELRDAQGALKAGTHFIGVSWGYQPVEVLEEAQHTAVVTEPGQIRKVINAR